MKACPGIVKLLSCCLALLVTGYLGGCTPLGAGAGHAQVYRLAPVHLPVQARARVQGLYIPEPELASHLESNKLVLFMPGNRQDFIAHTHWPDELGSYLQTLLIEELSRSNAFSSVSSQPLSTEKVWRLQVRVADFQAEALADNKARVRVGMEVLLIRHRDQHLLARHRYEQQSVVDLRTGQIVAGLERAFSSVMRQLLTDLLAQPE